MKKYFKIFPVFITVMLFLTVKVSGQSVQSFAKKALSHNQINGNEQVISKNGGMSVTNYGSPPFDNPNYYYAAVKTAPASVWYRQAGLSPDGTKIVAQKSYTDGPISRVEVVLMNADGSGEVNISSGSGEGDIVQNGNPFWSDDGLAIGYVEAHAANPNKVVKYVLLSATSSYIYEPTAPEDVNNADFLGNSTTSIVFWAYGPVGGADLFTWDGITLTNITNTSDYKEYEPVSNGDGSVILFWSGETVIEPINTTHTLTYSAGVWTKDVGFSPIVDSYWPYWSTRADNYIGITVASTLDVNIYNNTGTFVLDLTGPGYSAGVGQWNFLGTGFEGPNGEILMGSNANRGATPGRDLVFATPRTKLYVNASTGNDLFPGTLNAPFATIGKAVTEAISGGTVNVAAGTYTENLTLTKAITLLGPNANIDPNTGIRVAEATINGGGGTTIIPQIAGIVINGFTITTTNTGFPIYTGGADVTGLTISNNIISTGVRAVTVATNGNDISILHNRITGKGYGIHFGNAIHDNVKINNNRVNGPNDFYGIYIHGGGTINGFELKDNTIYDVCNIAANITNGTVSGNTFDVNSPGNMCIQINLHNSIVSNNTFEGHNTTAGLQIFGSQYSAFPSNTVTYSGNSFTNCNPYGIQLSPDIIHITILNNSFLNCYDGVNTRDITPWNLGAQDIHINNNSFVGSTNKGVNTKTITGTLDAEANWWGDITGPFHATTNASGLGSPVSDNVDYSPWLGAVAGTIPMTYYGNPADPNYVQDAIDSAQDGDTVNVEDGTYSAFTVNQSITLNGNGAIINNGSPAITVAANNVTINGFAFNFGTADYAIQINANFTGTVIENCNFDVTNAVDNQSTASVLAENNYWGFGGNINGPTIGSNPGGSGGVINENPGTVDYDPWVGKVTSPTNTYVGTPINGFTISWDWLSFFGPNFVFQLDHNGVAGSDVNTTVATNSYTVSSPLLYNTTYRWFVRSVADPLNVWVGPFTFTTTVDGITLLSPANGALGVDASANITFTWGVATGANLYQIQVDNDPAFGSPEIQTTTVALTINDGGVLLPGVVYNWRIRASNNAGISWGGWTTAWTFTTEYLVSPLNLAVGVSIIPLFDWLDVTGATSYTLEISTDNTFGTVDFTYAGLASSDYQVLLAGALVNGATYYWRVTSNNAVVSGTWAFIVVQPSMPYLTNPTNGSTLYGNTIYFTWYVLGSGASNFVLEVDDANDFLTPLQTFSGLTSSYYSWIYTGLTPGSTYYWRITAKTSGGVIVNYSSTWTFVAPGMPDVYPSYPIGGVTVYTNLPTLYWYTGTFYNGQFQIRYGTTSGALGAPIATSNMYYTLSGLIAGSTYYWQVRSFNGVQFGTWSAEQSFVVYSTTATTPVVPYLSWPIGGATVYTNPPSFYWYLGTYSTGLQFWFEYDDDSGFGSPNGNSGWISTLNYTLPTSLASGTWYWHVKSRLAAPPNTESSYSSTESFVIVSSASSVPTPTPYSPIGGATVYALNPTLTYYAYSTSALQYQINYSAWPSTDVNGVLDLANTTSVWTSSTSYILTGLTPGVTYYWQVRARLAATPASVSSWSSVATFTTAAGASAVVPLIGSPNYSQSIDNNTAVLSWIIPTQSSSPLTYTLQYSNKSDMSDAVTVDNVSRPEYELNGLSQNKTYYWRVSSKNTNGSSDYSSIGEFKTGGVTDVSNEQIIPTAFELSQNYPNPFNPTTKITYALPQNSYVSIKVYDMLGREIRSLVNNEVLAGNHSVDWNGDDNNGIKVASGTYVYRITAGSFIAVKKMILIK